MQRIIFLDSRHPCQPLSCTQRYQRQPGTGLSLVRWKQSGARPTSGVRNSELDLEGNVVVGAGHWVRITDHISLVENELSRGSLRCGFDCSLSVLRLLGGQGYWHTVRRRNLNVRRAVLVTVKFRTS